MIRMLSYGGTDLTIEGDYGKTAMDLATEAGPEKAAVLLGEGITKRFKQKRG